MRAASFSKRIATRRAKQRWSALVSAPTSRHAFEVDLASPDAEGKLKFLHLDHERPVRRTCERWSNLNFRPLEYFKWLVFHMS